CQSGRWQLQGSKLSAEASPDWGEIEMAGGLKLRWQRIVMKSCVSSMKYQYGGWMAFCDIDILFAKPFNEVNYYTAATGQDSAVGSFDDRQFAEGSEMSFGVMSQNRFGARFRISRVSGSNDSDMEWMGFTIFSIGR
ncbi:MULTISPECIES: hypothetical protein, partial [Chromobacterium]|uniref:hypothetical protein n=1 Tax=Chromobacterium TaxID=535 RepID=UPI001E60EE33